MKRMILYSIIYILTAAISLYAQKKFEGEIKYLVKYEGESININLFIQNANMKLEKQAGDKNEIFMSLNGVSFVLYPAQQIYAEYNDIKDNLQYAKPPIFENLKDELKLNKTGVKESIMGIGCEKWILKNPISEVEIWVTNEIEFNAQVLDALPKYFIDWQEALKKEKVFPLLVKIKDELGNTLYSFEAYNTTAGGIKKDTFVLPAGYKKTGKN
jgi:hypothetical protein